MSADSTGRCIPQAVKKGEWPANLKEKDDLTLALGEATGHHHTITEVPVNAKATLYEDGKGNTIPQSGRRRRRSYSSGT